MRPTVAVVDYGMGNRRSVEQALVHVGADAVVTRDHDALRGADALVLPGVGAFPRAMATIHELGLAEVLRERAAGGVPLLGICLGMQLLFDGSEELGGAEGLGLIPGRVTQLDPGEDGKLPHIGWNLVSFERPSPLTAELEEAAAFYHVHSYVPRPVSGDDVIGTAQYGERFASIVGRGPVLGVQFHPEKSSRAGLALLRGFVALASPAATSRAAA